MSMESVGWSVVGRTADVFGIVTVVVGVATVVLTASGVDPFADPDDTTLLVATSGFAIVGITTMITAVSRNLRDDAGFSDSARANSIALYAVASLMLALAMTAGLFLLLRPEPQAVPACRASEAVGTLAEH